MVLTMGSTIRLVLMSIALPPNPTPTDSAKRELRLQRLWLTPADANAVRLIADSFLSDYTEWLSGYSSQNAATSETTRIALVNAIVARIGRQLSSDGATRFMRYVQGEKAKMSIP